MHRILCCGEVLEAGVDFSVIYFCPGLIHYGLHVIGKDLFRDTAKSLECIVQKKQKDILGF